MNGRAKLWIGAIATTAAVACQHDIRPRAEGFDQVLADLPRGISDLTVDEHDHLWAVAERERVVAEIVLETSSRVAQIIRHPLDGIPSGFDAEAIAYLGKGRFAVGTEGHDQPAGTVMFGQLGADGHIVLEPGFSLTSEETGVELHPNQGVEAMCAAGAELVIGIESTGVLRSGARFAPIVRVSAGSRYLQQLELTTGNGKLSALSCALASDGSLDLLAIERDYGVTRILRARSRSGETVIRPTIVGDLWPMIHERFAAKLNLEGIVRLRNGRVIVVNDDQGTGLGGPTWLFISRAH